MVLQTFIVHYLNCIMLYGANGRDAEKWRNYFGEKEVIKKRKKKYPQNGRSVTAIV